MLRGRKKLKMAWYSNSLQSKDRFNNYQGGEFVCVYVGDGVKFGGTVFYPTQPGAINNDPEGGYEHYEPNPNVEPEFIEEDTDKEDEGMEEMS